MLRASLFGIVLTTTLADSWTHGSNFHLASLGAVTKRYVSRRHTLRLPIQKRILGVTTALALGGAVSGALSGALVIEAAVLLLLSDFAPPIWIAASSAIGAVFGTVVAPALAWSLLRRVPIGRAIAGIAVGAGLGGAVGVLMGAAAVNPYVPFAINQAPIPQGASGALLGAILAAATLRVLSRRSGISQRAG